MKRSQLNKIIREEYQRILFEAFGDPIASKLQRLGGVDTRYKKFWNAAANTYDIAWDKLPKGSFRKITNTAEAKKGMTFFVITSRKPNPFKTDKEKFEKFIQCYGNSRMAWCKDKNGRRFWFDPKWNTELV